MHPDENPKLEQGSRPHARETQAPVIQNLETVPVGDAESSLHINDIDIGALYLTVDAPQSYHEAMKWHDAAD